MTSKALALACPKIAIDSTLIGSGRAGLRTKPRKITLSGFAELSQTWAGMPALLRRAAS